MITSEFGHETDAELDELFTFNYSDGSLPELPISGAVEMLAGEIINTHERQCADCYRTLMQHDQWSVIVDLPSWVGCDEMSWPVRLVEDQIKVYPLCDECKRLRDSEYVDQLLDQLWIDQ